MSRTDLEPRFLVDPWVTVIWLLRRDTEDEEEEEEDDGDKDESDDEDKDNDEGDGYSVCPRKSCRTPGPRQLDQPTGTAPGSGVGDVRTRKRGSLNYRVTPPSNSNSFPLSGTSQAPFNLIDGTQRP